MSTVPAPDAVRSSTDREAWEGPVYELTAEGPRGRAAAGSRATIRRGDDRVSFEVSTSGVTPGNSYTVWVMAFNNPAACGGEGAPDGFRCGPADMGNADAAF